MPAVTTAVIGGVGAAASAAGAVKGLVDGGPDSPYTPEQLAAQQAMLNQAQSEQSQLINQLGAQEGLDKLQAAYEGIGQIGQGPGADIAGAQLNQVTGQNIASQAALLAGQRGAAANPALAARLIGQQGGALQQQAVGQAQQLRLQQEQQRELLRAQALQAQAGIAGGLVSAQQQAIQNKAALAAGAQQGMSGQNLAASQQQQAALQSGIENVGKIGAGLGAAGQQLGSLMKPSAPAQGVKGKQAGGPLPTDTMFANKGGMIMNYAEGGLVNFLSAQPTVRMAQGHIVPGKAKVKGDSIKNDVVPAMLSPGEIVIPRSKASNPEAAANFARAVAARNKKR